MKFTNIIEAQEGVISAGLKWETIQLSDIGISGDITGLCYGNGIFMLAINPPYGVGMIYISTDGCSWVESIHSTTPLFNGCWYLNGYFVVAYPSRSHSVIMASYDGINYFNQGMGTDNYYIRNMYSFKNHVFAIGANDNLYGVEAFEPLSIQGLTLISTNVLSAASNNEIFVYTYIDGSVIKTKYTYDGITWIDGNIGTQFNIEHLTYGNGGFLGSHGTNESFLYLPFVTNLNNWEASLPSGSGHVVDICYGEGVFVIITSAGKVFITNGRADKRGMPLINSGNTFDVDTTGYFSCYGNGLFLSAYKNKIRRSGAIKESINFYNNVNNIAGGIPRLGAGAKLSNVFLNIGQPNGLCELDATAKVPLSRLPDDYTGLDITRIIGGSF